MILLALAAITSLQAGSAYAQFLEDAKHTLGLTPDPIARSPRLVGMGRLTLAVRDRDNHIDLWDFAGNPVGVIDTDSSSVFEMRPRTDSGSGVHDVFSATGDGRERQDMAMRSYGFAYEAWERTSGGTTYGLLGDFQSLRHDQPFSLGTERRTDFSQPSVSPVIAGAMPFLLPDRLRYALFAHYSYTTNNDVYRLITTNAVGEYIDQDGQQIDPPDFFEPDEYTVTALGAGGALSYAFGTPLKAAISFDYTSNDINGHNEGSRYAAETIETRPYRRGQASAVGKLGDLAYGVDARGWKADSEEEWVFTISAGSGANPLAGRGKLLERREEGSSLRSRARWTLGDLELGAGFSTYYRQVEILAPSPYDPTSLNRFIADVFYRAGADTLVLPDSIASSVTDERAWDVGGGASWKLPGGKGLVGVEGHSRQRVFENDVAGTGPKQLGWDVRAGMEYPLGQVVDARAGYIHRWEDRDDYTELNEYLSNAATLGLGLHPADASWSVDAGYVFEWTQADFGDPGRPRESRQQLALLLRWAF